MILVNNNIKLVTPDPRKKEELIRLCTIVNPKFKQAMTLNLNVYGIPEALKYYSYDRKSDVLEIPVGLLDVVKDMFPGETIVDHRLATPQVKIPKFCFTGKLRKYQQEVVDALSQNDMGIIEAPTGSGKTVMMIAHLAKTQRPTLVLVNTIELANQFIERLTQFTDIPKESIGILGNGKKKIRPITVCLLQTVTKLDQKTIDFLNTEFSQVLSDEVHIVAAQTYYSAMNSLMAKYKYGFSATPEREDGLTPVLHFAAGPNIHTVAISNIKEKLAIPTYRTVNTDYYFPLFNTNEYQSMITDMAVDKDRNELVINLVKEYEDKQIVILCNRATQVLYLHDKIPGSEYLLSQIPNLGDGYKPLYKKGKISGKAMKKKDRENVIARLNSGETRVIISTVGLFSTGIDIASLEVMILASPIKSKTKIKQSLGRIMRKTDGAKAPVFVDLVDQKIQLLKYQANTRARIIQKAINV